MPPYVRRVSTCGCRTYHAHDPSSRSPGMPARCWIRRERLLTDTHSPAISAPSLRHLIQEVAIWSALDVGRVQTHDFAYERYWDNRGAVRAEESSWPVRRAWGRQLSDGTPGGARRFVRLHLLDAHEDELR
jgi:hypothetical protein